MTRSLCYRVSVRRRRGFSAAACWGWRSARLAGDHHLGRLDHRERRLPSLELQFVDGVPRDDGGEPLVADPEAHLGQQTFHPDFFDDPAQLVASADGDHHPRRPSGLARDRRRKAALLREQAVHFDIFAEYPVQVFNYSLTETNPSLSALERRTGGTVLENQPPLYEQKRPLTADL